MKSWINRIRQWLLPTQPLPPGVFHNQIFTPNQPNPHRLHLRIEADGTGLLVVDASTVLHLNQTAAEYAYHMLNNTPDEKAAREISKRYRVDFQQALDDYNILRAQVESITLTPDLDPETFLDMDRVDPFSKQLSAPYRLDCALTYRVPNGARKEVAPSERVKRELLTEEWKLILDKAWQAGIPHVVFTGGEPTLRPDLPEIIAHAEKLGQVTGLITDGSRLSEKDYLHQLLSAGLDHIMLILDMNEEQSWEALRDVLTEDIFTTVHLTITSSNIHQILEQMDLLKQMGVTSISLTTTNPRLKPELESAREKATALEFHLVWDLPVPYSELHPVALELADDPHLISGGGGAWLYVEPDGDVLPSQGVLEIFGNFLSDSWQTIWQRAQSR